MWAFVASILFISLFGTPSIVAHAAAGVENQIPFRRLLYCIYLIYLLGFASTGIVCLIISPGSSWYLFATFGSCILIALSMLAPFRRLLSCFLGALNYFASLKFIFGSFCKQESQNNGLHEASMLKQIFLPDSLPHLNGWILFLFALGLSLQKLKPAGFAAPSLGAVPEARQLDMILMGDFFTALTVVLLGIGLYVSRSWKEVFFRLSLVKPGLKEFSLGFLLCLATFFYDYIWSLFTHAPSQGGSYASVMKAFNEASFLGNGDIQSAAIVSLSIGFVAGIEEEITNRGALQPVIGILPSALLHAALHSQFDSAPLFMVQIFGWSTLMGIAKYYTNTSTTIIAHLLFNLISCFLISFNP